MDVLLVAIALIGLVLFKVLLTGKERDYRNSRAQRKMKRILDEVRLDRASDEPEDSDIQSQRKAKPPPLPGAENG